MIPLENGEKSSSVESWANSCYDIEEVQKLKWWFKICNQSFPNLQTSLSQKWITAKMQLFETLSRFNQPDVTLKIIGWSEEYVEWNLPGSI